MENIILKKVSWLRALQEDLIILEREYDNYKWDRQYVSMLIRHYENRERFRKAVSTSNWDSLTLSSPVADTPELIALRGVRDSGVGNDFRDVLQDSVYALLQDTEEYLHSVAGVIQAEGEQYAQELHNRYEQEMALARESAAKAETAHEDLAYYASIQNSSACDVRKIMVRRSETKLADTMERTTEF